jgi:hypothetical protein
MHLLMGKIGRPGCAPMQFAGQPNSMNTRETGADGTAVVRATIVEGHEHGHASTLKDVPDSMALEDRIQQSDALSPRLQRHCHECPRLTNAELALSHVRRSAERALRPWSLLCSP